MDQKFATNEVETNDQELYESLKTQISTENLTKLINQRFPDDPKRTVSVTSEYGKLAVFPYKSDLSPDSRGVSDTIGIGYWDYIPRIGGEPVLAVTSLPDSPEAAELKELIKNALAGTDYKIAV